MKALVVVSLAGFMAVSALQGSETLDRARRLEQTGDALQARVLLAQAAENAPDDVTALREYAEFLDGYADPGTRGAYEKLLAALGRQGDRARQQEISRRLVMLDLVAGDRPAALRHLEAFGSAGGHAEAISAGWQKTEQAPDSQLISIPGPLLSFSRMAAVSRDAQPQEFLQALARNVVTNGYQASHSNDALEQTEYLKLVHRYLSQARELEKLAGPDKVIRIETCDSPKVADLLRVLGFRMRGGCGGELVLETVNATRAFLTTDSGFPVPNLEQALRTNRPFTYNFVPTRVPVLFGPDYWISQREKDSNLDFIDVFLSDPSLCRLYLGLSKLDRATAEDLRKAVPMPRLRAFAHVLDFFGGMFEIRNGKVLVPGGAHTEATWAEMVGISPDQGAEFLEKLISKDDGWIASYFDALARIRGPVQEYLTEPNRMKRFYGAIRGKVTSPGPARPVFRSNADLMLLTTRMYMDANGQPHVPGNLETWRNLFVNHPRGKYDNKLSKAAASWKEPDDVLEALFGLCRKAVENEPLKIFMALSDLDRDRPTPLAPATVDRLARAYRDFGSQYSIFNEAPTLSDASIVKYLDTAEAINKIRDSALRADTAGITQALVGIWQIFVRQNGIPMSEADSSFSSLLTPLAAIRNEAELFDAGRSGVRTLLAATGSKAGGSIQDRFLDLLAGGTAGSVGSETHTEIVQETTRILEAQRMVSLDVLLQLADHLDGLARGERMNPALLNRLSSRISEIQLPRASLTTVEKNALSFGYWTEKHIEAQRRVNLRAVIEKAGSDKSKLSEARALLTPFLRDTLVAYDYAHYAPPGAQVLYTNPLFVRSHDFIGVAGANHTWRTTELFGTGWPSNGGGRLVGSLSGLPYALAEAEQNFLVPSQTQALIWGDLVPQMILSATVPRWWGVSPTQLHWVALHLLYGHALLAESALDPAVRRTVLDDLAILASPARTVQVGALLERGQVHEALERVTPLEIFNLARDFNTQKSPVASPYLAEIQRLAGEFPTQANYAAVSRDFGTPKPVLANSYRPELLSLRTFPTLMGYSSRILAESWESNSLYWAALADETFAAPSQLNVLVPEWTRRLVENIFASHLDDWPAVLRSLRVVGDDVRSQARARLGGEQKAALQ